MAQKLIILAGGSWSTWRPERTCDPSSARGSPLISGILASLQPSGHQIRLRGDTESLRRQPHPARGSGRPGRAAPRRAPLEAGRERPSPSG
ncbi:hypothetical protein NDU88_001863 [Pleurodeles waltl]|uniref:Uncharacterized protein n=1 Tax=Pleurodeles waltl TaxID=8319 RepID=A0AAV7V8Z7_PLEWA|nr:hypothetical protein NDU88_001863 [Pleurodeles waltl]